MDLSQWRNRLISIWNQYRYALIILIAGILLMTVPTPKKESLPATKPVQEDITLAEQLSQLLSQVSGAGKVRVLLTEAAGKQYHYQQDESSSAKDTVILTDSARNQNGLVRRIDPPDYLGAVVICQGADNPSVKLAITQAVANAAGLSYDRITVLKMK